MNTAPPTTVGWLHAAAPAPGIANAHFSLSCGTCSAVIRAAAAGWNRHCVCGSGLQPFHRGWVHGLFNVNASAHRFFIADDERGAAPPNGFPVTNSAIVRFSSLLTPRAFAAIDPV